MRRKYVGEIDMIWARQGIRSEEGIDEEGNRKRTYECGCIGNNTKNGIAWAFDLCVDHVYLNKVGVSRDPENGKGRR